MSKNSPNATVLIGLVGRISRSLPRLTLILATLLGGAGRSPAEHLYVPNYSFESQVTDYADPRVDDWQKTPQPAGFNPGMFGPWTNLAGVFINYPGTPGYIDNAAGQQLAFLFAYPQSGLFQDFNSTDWSANPPSHDFNSIYQTNRTYTLTIGLTSSSEEPLTQGSTLLLALYYRDANSNLVVISSNTVTYDTNVFTNLEELLDYKVTIPVVHAGDAWAGQNIGILIESTVAPNLLGGVWDLDNVRLTEGLYVPNFSFESPVTGSVIPEIDNWQESPQPPGFDSSDYAWSELIGVFSNATGPSFIDNAEGNQLAYLFADPQVAIFQDYNSTDWSGAAPTHAFNVLYQPGNSYTLTVGVTSSSEEPLMPGSTLQLSLYYRDASSNRVTVASTTVPYDTNIFTNITHLTDIQVKVPAVSSDAPWAGQNIGIQIASTVPPQLLGGVWDIDNVRLVEDHGVPNFSFESPVADAFGAEVDAWEKPPAPAGFDASSYGDWTNMAGVFVNDPDPNYYISNADGVQLAYLTAYPQVALFQDLNSTDWSGLPATHDFNVRFEPGKYYTMTVGITSSSVEPLTAGSTLELSLYYRDASSNAIIVASNTVTFTTNVFTNLLQLLDFSVSVPVVQATNAWANQNIGIQIQSTVSPGLIGGVWDLDNVRLTGAIPAALNNPVFANGQFRSQLQSGKNAAVAILATTNIALPLTNWTTLTTITNFTGSYPVVDIAPDPAHRFYQARKLP